jgi:hypothetical protein
MRGAVSLADSTRAYVDGIRILGPLTRIMIALAGEQTDFTQAVAAFYADSTNVAQGQMYGMLGRYREDVGRVLTPANARALGAWLPITAGVLPAGFDSIETALAARQPSPVGRANVLEMSTLLAFRMRGRGPALDTGAVHPVRRAQAWLARGDTAKARAWVMRFDSTLMRREPVTVDDGGWMFAAETYAALGDSARAFAVMLDWRRRWPNTLKHPNQRILDQNIYVSMPRLFGREWLLLGDLALARGDRVEARNAYQMVVRLWEGGDAPVQPLVARARAALATLPR